MDVGLGQKKVSLVVSSESNRIEEIIERSTNSQYENVAQLIECFG